MGGAAYAAPFSIIEKFHPHQENYSSPLLSLLRNDDYAMMPFFSNHLHIFHSEEEYAWKDCSNWLI